MIQESRDRREQELASERREAYTTMIDVACTMNEKVYEHGDLIKARARIELISDDRHTIELTRELVASSKEARKALREWSKAREDGNRSSEVSGLEADFRKKFDFNTGRYEDLLAHLRTELGYSEIKAPASDRTLPGSS